MSDKKALNQIDFSKYRTPELFQAFGKLLDVGGIYVRSFFKIMAIALLAGVIGGVAYWMRTESWIWTGGAVVYCLAAATFVGGVFAIIQVISGSMKNMQNVLQSSIDVTKVVAYDINSVRDGTTEMPSAKEMVRGVYDEVTVPIVNDVIGKQLGFFGGPILWLYMSTFDRGTKFVIDKMSDEQFEKIDEKKAEKLKEKTVSAMSAIADREAKIVGILDKTNSWIGTLGTGFRWFVMTPAFMVLAFISIVALAPPVVTWWIADRFQPDVMEKANSILQLF